MEQKLHKYSGSRNRNAPWEQMASYSHGSNRKRFGVMYQGSVAGRHGFLFHASCWSLLEVAYAPNPISPAHLFQLCRRRAVARPGHFSYDWTAADLELSQRNPEYVIPTESPYTRNPRLLIADYLRHDPLRRQGAYALLAACRPRPPKPPLTAWDSPNLFSRVVQVLGSSIAIHLTTRDFLSSRQVLRGLTPVFHDQDFWASRFEPGRERWWFFEAREGPADADRD